MNLLYKSTRSNDVEVTASQAILKGLADDGGLFVPESLPALEADMDTLAGMSYQETAYEVMRQFLTDFTEEELKDCIAKAYDEKFDTKEIAPLVKKDEAYYLELFHGKTIAFKDMALSILPHLLTTSAKKNQVKNEIVILTATSRRYPEKQHLRDLQMYLEQRSLYSIRKRRKPTGKADGNTERCQYFCSRDPWQF